MLQSCPFQVMNGPDIHGKKHGENLMLHPGNLGAYIGRETAMKRDNDTMRGKWTF